MIVVALLGGLVGLAAGEISRALAASRLPARGSSNLCLVRSRPDRPAGIETGVVLSSSDVLGDLIDGVRAN